MHLLGMFPVEGRRLLVRCRPSFGTRQGIEGDGTFYSNGAIHCDETNQLPVCIVFRILRVEFQNHAALHLQKIGCRSIRSLARS